MKSVTLNKIQITFLITFIKQSILSMEIDINNIDDSYKKIIYLSQIYDALTTDNNKAIPDESLRGNDSCISGNCD